MGPIHLGSRMGTTHGIYPWVALVMGNLMRRHFWVSCDVFLGGRGRGRGLDRESTAESFRLGRGDLVTDAPGAGVGACGGGVSVV